MDKEVARRELAGDIDAFGVHNIDNLAEFLIDRGWALDRSRATVATPIPLVEGSPDLEALLPVEMIEMGFNLDPRGREEWLPTHPNLVILRRSARKYQGHVMRDLPTYVISRLNSREYNVLGAGMGYNGTRMRASLTKIRDLIDKEGYHHAVNNTEEYKLWKKV